MMGIFCSMDMVTGGGVHDLEGFFQDVEIGEAGKNLRPVRSFSGSRS